MLRDQQVEGDGYDFGAAANSRAKRRFASRYSSSVRTTDFTLPTGSVPPRQHCAILKLLPNCFRNDT